MQGETQEAAATSSPDPLTLRGPQDRDIDVLHFPPKSFDSYEALKRNWSGSFQVLRSCVRAESALVLARFGGLQQKE